MNGPTEHSGLHSVSPRTRASLHLFEVGSLVVFVALAASWVVTKYNDVDRRIEKRDERIAALTVAVEQVTSSLAKLTAKQTTAVVAKCPRHVGSGVTEVYCPIVRTIEASP